MNILSTFINNRLSLNRIINSYIWLITRRSMSKLVQRETNVLTLWGHWPKLGRLTMLLHQFLRYILKINFKLKRIGIGPKCWKRRENSLLIFRVARCFDSRCFDSRCIDKFSPRFWLVIIMAYLHTHRWRVVRQFWHLFWAFLLQPWHPYGLRTSSDRKAFFSVDW